MTLRQFFNRKRGQSQPSYPVMDIADLPPAAQAFLEERKQFVGRVDGGRA